MQVGTESATTPGTPSPGTARDAGAALDATRRRRTELRESLGQLEWALAAPAATRAALWGQVVAGALAAVRDDFATHVEVTEGSGGLHDSILAGDVRLANAVGALTADHETITAEIARLVADTAGPLEQGAVPAVRERATGLLGHLVRHRQRGADLVYEAFQTDIGGVD